MATTPEPSTPPEVPESKQNSIRLNCDDQICVLTLRDAGFTCHRLECPLWILYY